ncbi:hypothetical protein ACFQU7_02370 [Pseudoroseomonas wenyumeiae]
MALLVSGGLAWAIGAVTLRLKGITSPSPPSPGTFPSSTSSAT